MSEHRRPGRAGAGHRPARGPALTLPLLLVALRLVLAGVAALLTAAGLLPAALVVLVSVLLTHRLAGRLVTLLGDDHAVLALDVLADRLAPLAVLAALARYGAVPWWLPGLAATVQAGVVAHGVRDVVRHGARPLPPAPVARLGMGAALLSSSLLVAVSATASSVVGAVLGPIAWAATWWSLALGALDVAVRRHAPGTATAPDAPAGRRARAAAAPAGGTGATSASSTTTPSRPSTRRKEDA